MNRFRYITFCLLTGFLLNAHAATVSKGLCAKLPGHWQGIFTIQDQNLCQQYKGCSHLAMADLKYVSEKTYELSLNFAIGHDATFNITCDKGVITSPVNPGNEIAAHCDEMNHCFVVYSDTRFSAELAKS